MNYKTTCNKKVIRPNTENYTTECNMARFRLKNQD